jgi:hypothetical protein
VRAVSVVTTLTLLGLLASSPGDKAVVPPPLQVELLSKVLRYDRNFAGRAGAQARVLVVYVAEAPDSESVARQLMAALQAQPRLGGVVHQDALVAFQSVTALAQLIQQSDASLVLLAPGLSPRASALAAALDGAFCLTVSSTPEGVREGLVLGFDLLSSKPKMLFNLTQARRQHGDFGAEVLQLMTVFQ